MGFEALFDLTGRVALVTGGTAGIGYGMATALAEAGAQVVIAGRSVERGERVLGEIGRGALFRPLDAGDPASCAAVVDEVLSACGRIDILVNNAGKQVGKAPQDFTPEEWQGVLDVNLTGPFVLSKAVYPVMRKQGGGKIINTASLTTFFGSAYGAAYAASKGGLGQLTKSLAVSWAADNIQVNAIMPGYVETALVSEAMEQRPDLHDRIISRTPAKRLGRPQDFTGATIFLASAASDFVTGAIIPVDGGYLSQG